MTPEALCEGFRIFFVPADTEGKGEGVEKGACSTVVVGVRV